MKMLRASAVAPTPHARPQLLGTRGQGSTWKLRAWQAWFLRVRSGSGPAGRAQERPGGLLQRQGKRRHRQGWAPGPPGGWGPLGWTGQAAMAERAVGESGAAMGVRPGRAPGRGRGDSGEARRPRLFV